MDLHSFLQRLFQYDDWANREVVAALQSLPYAPHKAVRLMAHVVAVEYLWLARLKGEADPAVWPEWNLQLVADQRGRLPETVSGYLSGITSDGLFKQVAYTNTKGQQWMDSIADILMHVTMHSAYHRGQIAMVLRDTGVSPPYTDYIQAVRTRQIEE